MDFILFIQIFINTHINEKLNNSFVHVTLNSNNPFFNQNKIKSSLNNISKANSNCEWFIMMNKDLLVIPGENKISIINVNKYKIENIIDINESGWICGICLLNENILLTGDDNKIIREWKIEGNNLKLISQKENTHNDDITYLINLGNGYIASASKDIKIW